MNGKGLMGLEPPGFSGVVRFGQRQVQIHNGVFNMHGQRYYVADGGQVTDESDNEVAEVKNGVLVPKQPKGDERQAA